MIDPARPDRVTYAEARRYYASVPATAPVCNTNLTAADAVNMLRGEGLVWMGVCPECGKSAWQWLEEAEEQKARKEQQK